MPEPSEPFAAPAAANWAEIFAGIDERRLLLERLTAAERSVARHIRAGRTNREIAARMKKSESTVKRLVSACLRKFRVPTRARLMALLR
ncbi:MAG TPA: helix-turn-helix transcriptional regulator [Opitutaceae bacterium]|nr:helix-turn-helix transcriptional regulator [Opitutaceae bacterium]